MQGTVEIIARDIPPEIMKLLAGEARHRDETIQERAVSIIAAELGVEREPSRRRFIPGSGNTDVLVLTVPRELRTKIRRRALQKDGTIRGVCLAAIASHFGLPEFPVGRRRRGKA